METQQKGRALYVVLALVFAGLIVGGATWFYMMGSDKEVATTQTTTDKTSTENVETSAQTELDGSLTELDGEIAAIEVDEESEDDTVDF